MTHEIEQRLRAAHATTKAVALQREAAARELRAAARAAVEAGWSYGDIATTLTLSRARVSQIVHGA